MSLPPVGSTPEVRTTFATRTERNSIPSRRELIALASQFVRERPKVCTDRRKFVGSYKVITDENGKEFVKGRLDNGKKVTLPIAKPV